MKQILIFILTLLNITGKLGITFSHDDWFSPGLHRSRSAPYPGTRKKGYKKLILNGQ